MIFVHVEDQVEAGRGRDEVMAEIPDVGEIGAGVEDIGITRESDTFDLGAIGEDKGGDCGGLFGGHSVQAD